MSEEKTQPSYNGGTGVNSARTRCPGKCVPNLDAMPYKECITCEKLSDLRSQPFAVGKETMSTPVMHSSETKSFDIAWVREQFPSLSLQYNHHGSAFLDGPAGTQVPKQVMDA